VTAACQITAARQITASSHARRLVVIGNGMAGCRFVQEVLDLDLDRRLAITVVGDEPGGAYNRMQLTNVLARAAGADAIELAGEEWYAAHGVTLRTPAAAVRVDRVARRVHLDDVSASPYDVLVLATGSTAVLPPVDGLIRAAGQLLPGAVAFRTLADCVAIDRLAAGAGGAARVPPGAAGVAAGAAGVAGAAAMASVAGAASVSVADVAAVGVAGVASAASAVVLGAGVLGLEAACGLAGRGLRVTLIQRGERLMERQLDAAASRVLTRTARSLGVRVLTGVAMRAVRGDDRVRGVVLDDGSTLDAELLVLCCGVRPRVELARECGLDVATGVVVDDQLRTSSDPDIFAIGECAEHRGQIYGLVAPAWEHARIAARVIARPGEPASYSGSLTVTRLKAAGIELASLGEATVDEDEDEDKDEDGTGEARRVEGATGADEAAAGGTDAGGTDDALDGVGEDSFDDVGDIEVVRFMDSARGVYQKLVVRGGRLVGAILLGDTRNVGTITQLFDRGAALPADRAALLMVRRNAPSTIAQSPTSLPGRATICQCNGVTKAGICAAWQDGARQVAEIAARTRATTGCGTCRDAVEGIVAWLAAADTGPADTGSADTGPADTGPGEPGTRPVPAGPQELGPSEYGQLPAGATA
jgi:assimilatory nitrate reductase electron transfer subunit